jgi:hypothetical protein
MNFVGSVYLSRMWKEIGRMIDENDKNIDWVEDDFPPANI